MDKTILEKFVVSKELEEILQEASNLIIPKDRDHLISLALGDDENINLFEVDYDISGKGKVLEATVARCNNGAVVNYEDIYMRRRDPDCLVVADDGITDKPRYEERYGQKFDLVRTETFDWFKGKDLIVMPFMSGSDDLGYPSLLIAPVNAGFFAAGLADLQGFIPLNKIPDNFKPKVTIYLAPTFRHTHFDGKQVVVHNRKPNMHELFSYNLYPGPSAKKGIYGVLLNIGEQEGWITAHTSAVKVITPYDNVITIMHEGASGGGKSEMLEPVHKQPDGSILLCENILDGDATYMELKETCDLHPVTDDMALCHPSIQNDSGKLVVKDAENGWFLRMNHITQYGTDPHYEKLSIHPKEPLIFFNLRGVPHSTCLLWEHAMDDENTPCPNPRVIMPRRFIPQIVNEPVEIDVRSFGVRTPPCTKENPTYGIIGMLHVLPPSLGWLWRLVAPRGHGNPSIIDTGGMTSEGVGSYWPFATGRMVDQANLLLEQIVNTPNTRFILIPNQNIGAYKVDFMPEWIAREYVARRGSAKFRPEQLTQSRCPLLGYSLNSLKVDGNKIPKGLLQTHFQPEVGDKGYDKGAKILTKFFKKELKQFLCDDLNALGREIIECCLSDGSFDDYFNLIKTKL